MKCWYKGIALALICSLVGCGGSSIKPRKHKKKQDDAQAAAIELRVFKQEEQADSVRVNWSWEDYAGNVFQVQYALAKKDIQRSKTNREALRESPMVKNSPDYGMLTEFDAKALKPLAKSLKKIAKDNQFNERQTVDMVITMIQNIEYTLVHPYTHTDMEKLDKENGGSFIAEYHGQSEHKPWDKAPYGGCEENIDPAGVYSPVEFLTTYRGDCDTRTITVYTLLKLLNIESIVVNGPGHSMLALPYAPSNPAAPVIQCKGQNYYFLETTVFIKNEDFVGPQIGDVPQEFNATEWFPVLI
jgi:hypothetical protein